MRKFIFIWASILILLSSLSVSSQTVPKDTSQKEILEQKGQIDSLRLEFEKVKKDNYEKAMEGANQSILISTLVVLFVTLLAIAVGIFGYFRIREIKTDYKETKAELMRRFEEDLEKVKEYKEDIKEICEEMKERRKFAEREIQEIESFKKRIEPRQKEVPADFSKEVSKLIKKDSKTAIEDYEKVMNKIFGESIYSTMAYNYYVGKKYEESIGELKKVIKLNPNRYDAYFNWGVALGKLGRHEETIEKFKKAIELKPDDADAYYNWGVALGNLCRYEEEIEKYKKAIELEPDYADAYVNWGVALGKLGRYEEEIEKCRKATELKPDYAKAYSNWGVALGKLGRYEQAIEKCKKATELKPDFAEAYVNWGAALGERGRHEEAIEKCKKATELKPDYADAWYNIACIYSLQNRKEEALEHLKKAIELDVSCKEDAKTEEDFKNLWKDEDFKKLVG